MAVSWEVRSKWLSEWSIPGCEPGRWVFLMTTVEDATLDIQPLVQTLAGRLVAMVLFGSRARGDSRADSDWDLLLIAYGLPHDAFERQVWLNDLLVPCGVPASVVAKTPQEFEAHLPALYLDIATDGTILYDPSGYAAKKLKEIRALVGRLGLYRERTPSGDRWRWRDPPPQPWQLSWDLARSAL